MKHIHLYCATLLAAATTITGCSKKNSNAPESDSRINNFQVVQTIKSAERDYSYTGANAVFNDSIPVYSKVSVTIQWPDKMGAFNIKPLQDSLMAAIYESPKASIDETILAALEAPRGKDIYKMEPVDSIPTQKLAMTLYNDKIASAVTFNPNFIVYQVMSSIYDGGAHGMSVSRFINYDFDSARVITPELAFRPGSDEKLLDAVKNQLMKMYGVSSLKDLNGKGVFSDQIFLSKEFYLQGYNIVFHYNPYDIAPYSTGSIDVPVPYYTISEYLSPEVLRLFASTEI
ncbi:RsiV family protein [uncultured Muribaculum sp.]|uniref:RsiV family protein n=1 Tax=uncultured Muribaculum sp. TaxID=1918613 RepID=UPI0025E3B575|nr:RsiV family protein [uncultured Muribaculum sp.]